MLNNKRFNMILALIAAIALWAYVLGEINPESSTTVRDVPIAFTNLETLEDQGLTILSSSETTVNINISGQRTAITKADVNDFKVAADVEGLKAGKNTVRLEISGPDDVKIEHVNNEKIEVTIDKLAVADKPVDVHISGEIGDDKEADIGDLRTETVKVTGAKTLVDKVNSVRATIEQDKIEETSKTFTTHLTPVDKNGIAIENLRLNVSEVKIEAVMLNKKTVRLEVPVINNNDDADVNVSAPNSVVIKGKQEDLDGITSISCRDVDLSRISQDTTIELQPILPEGIKLSNDNSKLEASVTVKNLGEKTFTYNEQDIKIENGRDGARYTFAATKFEIKAVGKENALSQLSSADISLSVDVSGLEKGTHKVKLKAHCSKTGVSVGPLEDTIEIAIE